MAGMATQQKDLDAVLLVPCTESVRLRSAVTAFRTTDLLGQFLVLDADKPEKADVFLRYFADRSEKLRN